MWQTAPLFCLIHTVPSPQVQSLCNLPTCGGIPATFISSQQSKAELVAVLRELSSAGGPTCKLIYVTPEQLVKSTGLNNILGRLYQQGLLARLVVDEVRIGYSL
jgi:bloom syndrome protein